MMNRLRSVHWFVIAGFLFLCSILAYYQVVQFSNYKQLSQANRIRIVPHSASRGRIFDRNGKTLAGNAFSYNLLIMPQEGQYPVTQITKLSQILSVPIQELRAKYNRGFIAPFALVLLYKDISLSEAIAIGQLKYDLPAIVVQRESKRTYPLDSLASHVLGYLGYIDAWRLARLKEYGYKIQDLVGYSGIEEVYDYVLRPRKGGMQIEVDSKGRVSRVLGFKAAQKGKDVKLTLDVKLQNIVHQNLNGKIGCVVILDPANGDVLALASYPDFNPQVFQDGDSASLRSVLNDGDSPMLNRAITGLYPPGSVFKVPLAMGALEKRHIGPYEEILCSGNLQIGNRSFACWDTHDEENIVDALAHSCNVFFYALGLRSGPQLINEYALKFGFGQLTGIDLNNEFSGFVPYSLWQRIKRRKGWFAGDTANFSIGQGDVLATPLQVARMIAAFANDGKLVKPRLLKSIHDGDRVIDSGPPEVVDLALDKHLLRRIKDGLEAAVSDKQGTANILSDLNVRVAGKTGSAQAPYGLAHGWFAGYFPANKPKFAICVFLEHVDSGYYSCLLTKDIIMQMLEQKML